MKIVNFNSKMYTYDVINNSIQILKIVGEEPEHRIRQGVLSAGAGMVIMYGGAHIEGKGYFIDLWHFVVNGGMVEFKQIDYKEEGDNLFMTWRHGFTMHYIRGMEDPVLIGGTYGNNQQSNVLVTLPETKWKDVKEFASAECSPCPRGSVFRAGMCKWWTRDQFFKENSQNYFASECRRCPLGLVGGNYKACIPCPAGHIFDLEDRDVCKKWEQDEICPLGTRYAFPYTDFDENFIEVRLDSHPNLLNPHKRPFDHTSIIVVFAWVSLSLLLFIGIGIALTAFKEKSLFILREIDLTFITGGNRRRVVGGVIMLFFTLVVTIVTFGFLINYFLFNSRTVVYETKNPFTNKAYPASYQFKFMLYTSRFVESTDPSGDDDEDTYNSPLPDLCKSNKIKVAVSRYFGQVEDVNKQLTCVRRSLTTGTDEYNIVLTLKNIRDEVPNNDFVRIEVESEYEQIFHFFKWEYWNIWRYYGDYPISYSKVSGFITPQMTTRSNKNITAAFRGPASTKLEFKLTPTHYGNEIESQNFEGYQVYLDEYVRGSIVDERTMANSILSTGRLSKGFSLELFSDVSDKINHVEVQRVKSIIEIIAYIFGFTAGFIIIAHLLKYFLSKEEYFKGLDRECDTLFGTYEEESMIKLNRFSKNSSEITLKDEHN